MKKIVINGLKLFDPGMFGIKRNTLEILKQLDKIVDKNEVYVLVPKDTQGNPGYQNIIIKELSNPINLSRGKVERNFNLVKWLYFDIKKEKEELNAIAVDLLLQFPAGSDVVTIYDCIPEMFPQYFRNARGILHRIKLKLKQSRSVKTAKLILTDSWSAAEDISRIYKAPKSKLRVVPCAWDHFRGVQEDDSVFKELGLTDNSYLFTMGHSSGHKNIKWVHEAAKQNLDELFVISGNPVTDHSAEDHPNVLYTGYLNDGQMKCFMKNCKAFILPSFYEGFGIPPMEAMSVGADCIVANTGSLPEVYKDSVWYIDPYNYDNIDIKEIMSRKKEPNEAILCEYNWEKSAAKFIRAIKELC